MEVNCGDQIRNADIYTQNEGLVAFYDTKSQNVCSSWQLDFEIDKVVDWYLKNNLLYVRHTKTSKILRRYQPKYSSTEPIKH